MLKKWQEVEEKNHGKEGWSKRASNERSFLNAPFTIYPYLFMAA